MILGPVAKCWVVLVDSGKSGKEVDELKEAMKDICHELAKAVPSAVEVRILPACVMIGLVA